MADQRVSVLLERLSCGELSRRQFIQRALGLGVSISAISAALAGGAVAAPGGASKLAPGRAATDPKTLVVLDSLPAQNWLYLDPAVIYEINPAAAHNLIYETLYHLPDATKLTDFQPLLADGMPTFSSDGLAATIKLKQNVKFHKTGNVMTADDWVFSWNRLANLQGNPSFLFTDNITKVEAAETHVLKVTLKAPNAAFVAIITAIVFAVTDSKTIKEHGGSAQPPAPSAGATPTGAAKALDPATDWINKGNSAGTGPFMLTGWDVANEVTLDKNPDYWGEAPKLDRVIFRNVADANTQLQLIQTGDADLAFAVDPDSVDKVKSDPNLQLLEGASLAIEYLALNNDPTVGGPLAKKEVRQAIAFAIDYDGIIKGLLNSGAVRPATIVPLGLLGADETKDAAYKTDLAKAQQLFNSAGVGEVEVTLSYGANQATPAGLVRDTLAAKLQSDIQKIKGLKVKLNPMDPAERLKQYRAGKIQFTMSDWSPDYPDVHTYAEPFGHTGSAAAKRVHYSHPDVDKMLEDGIKELDEAKRKQDYIAIQKRLIDDAAFLVEFQPNYRSPASKKVQGVQPHGLYILQLRHASKTG